MAQRECISFYTGRITGGSKVWRFVGSKSTFPVYHGASELYYSGQVRSLWPTPMVEPILAFLEERWGVGGDMR